MGSWHSLGRLGTCEGRLPRGGPVVRRSGIDDWSLNLNTDSRKNVVVGFFGEVGCNHEGYCSRSADFSIQLRPASNVSISLGPSIGHNETGTQYVRRVTDATATAGYGSRYVFADLFQNTGAMNTRLNITFSPNLTLQLFIQPLIVTEACFRYKQFRPPHRVRQLVY